MNRIALFVIAGIIGLTLLLFTCTYQVRFNEVAIVTTFRRISGEVVEPGLHVKWPYPIQSVTHYDSRIKVLETRLENVVTKDNQLVIVQLFLTWKISDASTFFKVLTTEASAQRRLQERLRSAQGAFSEFEFHDLLGPGSTNEGSRLADVEERIMAILTAESDDSQSLAAAYGVEPVAVGISRFILPDKTSQAVFERMKTTRQRLAADLTSSGAAEAERLTALADADARMIEAFAKARAAQIRSLGDAEAAKFAEQLGENESFAIFLQKLAALERMMTTKTKVILPSSQAPFDLLNEPVESTSAAGATGDEN